LRLVGVQARKKHLNCGTHAPQRKAVSDLPRYIDTKHLFKCETCRHYTEGRGCNTFCDCGECYSPNMNKIPNADVVEVVRCKDCDAYLEYSHCEYMGLNGFCSLGFRTQKKEVGRNE
jgi:hypothetical protein